MTEDKNNNTDLDLSLTTVNGDTISVLVDADLVHLVIQTGQTIPMLVKVPLSCLEARVLDSLLSFAHVVQHQLEPDEPEAGNPFVARAHDAIASLMTQAQPADVGTGGPYL